jgi:hypothetical protein
MTESEWLTCDDWRPMLKYLQKGASNRKRTLYLCAGLRTFGDLIYSEHTWEALGVAERAVEGNATEKEIADAAWAAECPTFESDFDPEYLRTSYQKFGDYSNDVKNLLKMGVYSEADIQRGVQEGELLGDRRTTNRLRTVASIAESCLVHLQLGLGEFSSYLLKNLDQCNWPKGWLVREIFGNPFRETPFNPDWRSETVLDIAQGAYEERAFERLAVLSDALLDAGCDDGELLEHLRSEGPHFKGCWALDKVLGL